MRAPLATIRAFAHAASASHFSKTHPGRLDDPAAIGHETSMYAINLDVDFGNKASGVAVLSRYLGNPGTVGETVA
jgi:hypothetical protein